MTAVIEKKKKRLVWLKRDWRLYLMLILPIAQYILFRYILSAETKKRNPCNSVRKTSGRN